MSSPVYDPTREQNSSRGGHKVQESEAASSDMQRSINSHVLHLDGRTEAWGWVKEAIMYV